MKSDAQIQRDILDELQWEPSIEANEIGATFNEGVATLTGHASTYHEKVMAERVTKRIHGVKAVANEIEVRIHGFGERTDADIAKSAIDALKWKLTVPDDRIKASVTKGWVTLEGEVDWYYQKEAAEEAIRYLPGVRGVVDQIAIKPGVSAAEVKSRIEAAFHRSADIDAKAIRVETHDRKVTLRGNVHSFSERQEAERTAWAAPGVKQVENLISVIPVGR